MKITWLFLLGSPTKGESSFKTLHGNVLTLRIKYEMDIDDYTLKKVVFNKVTSSLILLVVDQ